MLGYDEAARVQERDKKKQTLCKEQGITLIVVPFWWDRTLESVAHTIHLSRPDVRISSLKGYPIPQEMPTLLIQSGMYTTLFDQIYICRTLFSEHSRKVSNQF